MPRNSGHLHEFFPSNIDAGFGFPIPTLHRSGRLTYLRTEMRSAYLRHQVVRGLETSRTFEIGTVFRQSSESKNSACPWLFRLIKIPVDDKNFRIEIRNR